MDALVIQLEGRKDWTIYLPHIVAPMSHQIFKPSANSLGNPVAQVTLSPGDVLYIPRGWLHEARVPQNSKTSVHLTFGLDTHASTWSLFLHGVIESIPASVTSPREQSGICFTLKKPELPDWFGHTRGQCDSHLLSSLLASIALDQPISSLSLEDVDIWGSAACAPRSISFPETSLTWRQLLHLSIETLVNDMDKSDPIPTFLRRHYPLSDDFANLLHKALSVVEWDLEKLSLDAVEGFAMHPSGDFFSVIQVLNHFGREKNEQLFSNVKHYATQEAIDWAISVFLLDSQAAGTRVADDQSIEHFILNKQFTFGCPHGILYMLEQAFAAIKRQVLLRADFSVARSILKRHEEKRRRRKNKELKWSLERHMRVLQV